MSKYYMQTGEIADALDMDEEAVKSTIKRAIQKIKLRHPELAKWLEEDREADYFGENDYGHL